MTDKPKEDENELHDPEGMALETADVSVQEEEDMEEVIGE